MDAENDMYGVHKDAVSRFKLQQKTKKGEFAGDITIPLACEKTR